MGLLLSLLLACFLFGLLAFRTRDVVRFMRFVQESGGREPSWSDDWMFSAMRYSGVAGCVAFGLVLVGVIVALTI
jgi:hypothetical protein